MRGPGCCLASCDFYGEIVALSLSASPVLRSPRLSAITFSRGGGMNYEGSPLARRLLLNKKPPVTLRHNVDRDCDPPNNVMRAISRRASRTRTTRSHNPKREHSNVACRVLLQNIARKQRHFSTHPRLFREGAILRQTQVLTQSIRTQVGNEKENSTSL